MGKKRRREEENEKNETVSVKRRYVSSVSVEANGVFSQGRDLGEFVVVFLGKTFWRSLRTRPDCEPEFRVEVSVVPDVTDLLVSPASVVTEVCDSLSFCSDWDLVEPQSFSFSQKACSLLLQLRRKR